MYDTSLEIENDQPDLTFWICQIHVGKGNALF